MNEDSALGEIVFDELPQLPGCDVRRFGAIEFRRFTATFGKKQSDDEVRQEIVRDIDVWLRQAKKELGVE